jgi:MscS family membrane protein
MKKIITILLISFGSALFIHGKTNDSLTLHPGDTLQLQTDSTQLPAIIAADATITQNKQEQRKSILNEVTENTPAKPREVLESISFSKIFWTIILLIITYYFIKLIISLLTIISEKFVRLRIAIKSLIPIVRIVVWIIIIAAIVKGIFDPPIETIIAVGASVGIAVGFAAQDLLKNFFGGIALLLDKPFQVGDKIDTGKYYGEVIEIGLRATRIVTPDDSTVSVPNAELINSSVSNSNSGQLDCQVVAEIFIPTTVDTEKVRKIATEAAQASRFIYLNKPIVVLFFNEINNRKTYLKMRIKAYVMDIRYEFQFKSDMTEIVIRELMKEGIIKGNGMD